MSTPFYDLASLVVVPSGYKASKVYAQKPLTTDGQLTFSRASTATRVNSAGLIETVSSNVPRLDYLGSTCPKLLLEPQRQNLTLYSSAFDEASYWYANNATITANNAISPDGTSNADMYTATGSSNFLNASAVSTGSNTITYSVFAKAGTQSVFRIREAFYFGTSTTFNLSTGTVTSGTGTITSYGNGWFRCTHSQAYGAGQVNLSWIYDTTGTSGNFYLYGAQAEVGAYATSLIETTSGTVTRLADAASKTGISSLIGQTEGTIFVEEFHDATVANNSGFDDTLVALTDGTSANIISIFHYGAGGGVSNQALFFIRLNNVTQALIASSSLPTGNYKMALAYKNNDVVAYINGVQIGTDTSASIPATSVVTLVDPITTNAATKTVRESQVLLFKTRLTNAQLAELTTL